MDDPRYARYLLLPALIIFLALGVYPTIEALWTSLTAYNLTDPASGKGFIGLSNYVHLIKDLRFWLSLGRTFCFVPASVGISFLLGLGIALLLERVHLLKSFFRTVFLVPMVIAPAITALNFKFMYNYNLGIINKALEIGGLGKIDFLGDPELSLWSCIAVDVWQWTPLVILILLAGLEALPREPFEAAMIDGANAWQVFRHIKLPLLNRFTVIALVIRVMDSIRVYEVIQLMTSGGPGTASETSNIYLSNVGFNWFRMGYASSMGIALLILTSFLAWLLIKASGAFSARESV